MGLGWVIPHPARPIPPPPLGTPPAAPPVPVHPCTEPSSGENSVVGLNNRPHSSLKEPEVNILKLTRHKLTESVGCCSLIK